MFCNQASITGEKRNDSSIDEVQQDIENTIKTWLAYRNGRTNVQFAFYGGSFTCLPLEMQTKMLAAVKPWLSNGEITGIRLSTRPDCIDQDMCEFLLERGVITVELGVQSLDEVVLSKALRGHTVADCLSAARQIKTSALHLGIQLMPGLPGETRYSFIQSVKKTIGLLPEFVRLYPALVVRQSGLEKLYKSGDYSPLSLPLAVVMASWARRRFLESGIAVARMGLQPSESLEKSLVAGPYHPAFGELAISREWFAKVKKIMAAHPQSNIIITISDRDLSSFNGLKRENIVKLMNLKLTDRLQVRVDKNIERGEMHYVVS